VCTEEREKIVALQPALPLQQLVDKQLARAGVVYQPTLVLNYLNTQIAMVAAGEGIAVVPSFALPECQNRKLVMSRLVDPVVPLDFFQIRRGGRKLSPVAEEFTSFLQSYIAKWAHQFQRQFPADLGAELGKPGSAATANGTGTWYRRGHG
jgi:DNA-binding transcriptional LysR family regulator